MYPLLYSGLHCKRAYNAVKHCHCCKAELFTNKEEKFSEMVFRLRRSEIMKLKLPQTKFFRLFDKMYDTATLAVPQICTEVKVRSYLKAIIRKVLNNRYKFSCPQHNLFDVVINLFTTFYVRVWTSNVNRILFYKDERFINDIIKKLALDVANKRRGRVKKVQSMKSRA